MELVRSRWWGAAPSPRFVRLQAWRGGAGRAAQVCPLGAKCARGRFQPSWAGRHRTSVSPVLFASDNVYWRMSWNTVVFCLLCQRLCCFEISKSPKERFEGNFLLFFPYIVLVCCAKSFSRVWLFVDAAPLSMGILQARILEWVAMPFLLQGILPTQGSNPRLLRPLNCRLILYRGASREPILSLVLLKYNFQQREMTVTQI